MKMSIPEQLIIELSNRINTERSKREYIYIPPYDVKRSIEVFLEWLNENGYKIIKEKK